MLAVGEEAGRGDRPRRPDRVRAQARRQLRQRARQVPRGSAVGIDDLAVDRRDLHAPIGGLQRRQRDLVLLAELRQHADDARVDPPGVDLGDPGRVDHQVLVGEQGQRLRGGRDGRDRDLGAAAHRPMRTAATGRRRNRGGRRRAVSLGAAAGNDASAGAPPPGSVGSLAAGDDGSAPGGRGRRAGSDASPVAGSDGSLPLAPPPPEKRRVNRRAAPVMPPDLPLSGSAPLTGPFSGDAFSGVTATAPEGTSADAPPPSGAPGSASEPGRALVVSSSASRGLVLLRALRRLG